MIIRAKSKYDFDSIKALAHLSMFKKADPKKRMRLWVISFVVLFAVVILEMLFFGADMLLIVSLAVAALCFVLICYLYFIYPKIQYKSLRRMQNTENDFLFCDELIKITSKGEEYDGTAEIKYSLLVKVYETLNYFFLFQTNNQVFIVDKSTIEGGTIDEIRNKLCFSVKKYIMCDY